MSYLRKAGAIAILAGIAACGAGTPATQQEAEETLREKFADDDYHVTWIHAMAKDEPGEFRVFIDRVEKGDPQATETQLCNASVSSNTHTYSCKVTKPGMMNQAAEVLVKEYTSRGLEVKGYHVERSGKGNAFTGYFELVDPSNGLVVQVPCKGDQVELNSDIECDPAYADAAG
jgi:hypothetical protein